MQTPIMPSQPAEKDAGEAQQRFPGMKDRLHDKVHVAKGLVSDNLADEAS
jgi:hypothetical protein